jgi:hypothetical protein
MVLNVVSKHRNGGKEGMDMAKLENIVEAAKLGELIGKKEQQKKKTNVLLWILAIIGIIAAVAAICYAVYRFLSPDYLDDFEDDFDDDYYEDEDDDDLYEDESEQDDL